MSKFNFFDRRSISTTTFTDHAFSWDFISAGIMLLNESENVADVVQYSFNGSDLHGDLRPGTVSAAIAFDSRHESKVYFRLASGAATLIVRVETWA